MPKENTDIFANYICRFSNEPRKKYTFLSILKNANITPVFQKGYKGCKENYRPVSILPVISKLFEKLLCKQIAVFIDPSPPNANVGSEKLLVLNIVYSQCLKNRKTLLTKRKCLVYY